MYLEHLISRFSSLKLKTGWNILFFNFLKTVLAAPGHTEFLGQGLDLSHSCALSSSCGNARSLTHCEGPGIKPTSQGSRETSDPIVLQKELRLKHFKKKYETKRLKVVPNNIEKIDWIQEWTKYSFYFIYTPRTYSFRSWRVTLWKSWDC